MICSTLRFLLQVYNGLKTLLTPTTIPCQFINRIEVLSTAAKPNTAAITEAFIAQSDIVPLEEAIVQVTIELRRQVKIKLPDAVIAATALVHNLTVVTRNIDDFKKVPGLSFLNPHDVV